jgi:hypothetical protein
MTNSLKLQFSKDSLALISPKLTKNLKTVRTPSSNFILSSSQSITSQQQKQCIYKTNKYDYEKTANGTGDVIYKHQDGFEHQIKFAFHYFSIITSIL